MGKAVKKANWKDLFQHVEEIVGDKIDAHALAQAPKMSPIVTAVQKNRYKSYFGGRTLRSILYKSVMDQKADVALLESKEFDKLLKVFVKKTVTRLRSFLFEATRTIEKINLIFKKLEEMGYVLTSREIKKIHQDAIFSNRKKIKHTFIYVTAEKQGRHFTGYMEIKPCSISLMLECKEIRFSEPVVQIRFFKNLSAKENFLGMLVKGEEKKEGNYSDFDSF